MTSIKLHTRKMKAALILVALATAIMAAAIPFNTAATLPPEYTDEPVDMINKPSTTKSTTTSTLSDTEKEKLLLGFGINNKTKTKEASRSAKSIASTLSDSEKERLLLNLPRLRKH